MRLKATVATFLILCLVSTFGCMTSADAALSGTFHFRAYIDGSDYVCIQNAGGKVWYEHLQYDYPGEHEPYTAASPATTTVDGVDWTPTWDKTAQKSNTYTSSSPQNYPTGAWTALSVNKITSTSDTAQSRGPVTIEQFPSNSNSYTAKVLLNDDTGAITYRGGAWYEFELSWEASSSDSGFPVELIAVAIIIILAVAVFLVFLMRRRSRTKTE